MQLLLGFSRSKQVASWTLKYLYYVCGSVGVDVCLVASVFGQ